MGETASENEGCLSTVRRLTWHPAALASSDNRSDRPQEGIDAPRSPLLVTHVIVFDKGLKHCFNAALIG
jgi:hypothetical protein